MKGRGANLPKDTEIECEFDEDAGEFKCELHSVEDGRVLAEGTFGKDARGNVTNGPFRGAQKYVESMTEWVRVNVRF